MDVELIHVLASMPRSNDDDEKLQIFIWCHFDLT